MNYNDLIKQPAEAQEKEGFTIENLDTASWASRKAHAAATAIADLEAWRKREIERINEVYETETGRLKDTLDFFTHALAIWLKKQVDEGRKTKSFDLPGGRIALRSTQPKIHVDNEAAMLEWARANAPGVIKVRESIDQRELRKAIDLVEGGVVITPDGEPVPARWEQLPDNASFKPAEHVD